eukprot:Skav206463  [mRNA]  locus=scaffold3791:86450:92671:+ [translate_table: standard]
MLTDRYLRADPTIFAVPHCCFSSVKEILEMYAAKLVLDDKVDLKTLARRTAGMTGADLANILNIAAVRSSAENLRCIPTKYLEEAFDRVVVGDEEMWNYCGMQTSESEHDQRTGGIA